jgi:hypothetical protein
VKEKENNREHSRRERDVLRFFYFIFLKKNNKHNIYNDIFIYITENYIKSSFIINIIKTYFAQ